MYYFEFAFVRIAKHFGEFPHCIQIQFSPLLDALLAVDGPGKDLVQALDVPLLEVSRRLRVVLRAVRQVRYIFQTLLQLGNFLLSFGHLANALVTFLHFVTCRSCLYSMLYNMQYVLKYRIVNNISQEQCLLK